MSRTALITGLAAVLTLCACSDDPSGDETDAALADGGGADAALDSGVPTCGANGGGTVTGTVAGAAIDPIARAYIIHEPTTGWDFLFLDEAAGGCNDPP